MAPVGPGPVVLSLPQPRSRRRAGATKNEMVRFGVVMGRVLCFEAVRIAPMPTLRPAGQGRPCENKKRPTERLGGGSRAYSDHKQRGRARTSALCWWRYPPSRSVSTDQVGTLPSAGPPGGGQRLEADAGRVKFGRRAGAGGFE